MVSDKDKQKLERQLLIVYKQTNYTKRRFMIVFDFYRECAVWIAAALAVTAVIGLFKRNFLSHSVVYPITMLLSIFFMCNGVLAISSGSNVLSYLIASHVIVILSLAIYIRGHIFPTNEDLDIYNVVSELNAAKRLIFTGFLGVCLYTILSVAVYCYSCYYAEHQRQIHYDHFEDYGALIIAVTFIFCIFMVAAAGLLVTNGCIRYILNTDRTEENKKRFILLTFIPIFNVVYGVICLKKISKRVKITTNCK